MSSPVSDKRAVVFLDRDGTLNKEVGYIRNLADLVLIEGAASAVRALNAANIAAILVTNQTGAARGYYSEEHIRKLNQRLQDLLKAEGAILDAVYYCPHLLEGTVKSLSIPCNCRKPETGMVEQAFQEHQNLERSQAYVVGDKSTDIELAKNCNIKGVLVSTGYGQQVLSGTYQWPVNPDFVAADITAAVNWILSDLA